MSGNRSILVLGSSNTDFVLRVDHLPQMGETVLGNEFLQTAGGKGANQAVAAARLGGTVRFIAGLGDDSLGKAARTALAAEGIDVSHVVSVPAPSGVALILVDAAGSNLIGVGPGANGHWTEAQVATLPQSLFDEARVFVTQLETPADGVRAALERAQGAGCLTLFNPAPVQRAARAWLPWVDLLVVNELEASLLALESEVVAGDANPAEAAEELIRLGAREVIVTLGEKGCLWVAGGTRESFPSHRVAAVDTVAAGDAFVGALAVRLAEDRSVREAIEYALAASALAVTRPGAQASLPTAAEVAHFLAHRVG